MGYVFDHKDARACEAWYADPANARTVALQSKLLKDMLRPSRGERVLDIGCGTGASLEPLFPLGLQLTGIDPSEPMLRIARERFGNRVAIRKASAEALPFDDNAFHHAVLMTSLEFVEDPVQSLQEACRVAKDRLFIGVFNRYAIKNIQRRVKGVFTETIYNRAQFFSVWELKDRIHSLLGDAPVQWRTICQISSAPEGIVGRFEESVWAQRCPFGTLAGLTVDLVPRFRTRPLELKVPAKGVPKPVAG